jgi:hypothetical protein
MVRVCDGARMRVNEGLRASPDRLFIGAIEHIRSIDGLSGNYFVGRHDAISFQLPTHRLSRRRPLFAAGRLERFVRQRRQRTQGAACLLLT